uniref:Uncharacterized protein n=1 Tax=Cacopsylla melanoneura TaxID=428564 RepID=A0A8D8SDE5_9HEMI
MSLSKCEILNMSSSKKRKCDPDNWIDKKQKAARNSGEEYRRYRGRGDIVQSKQAPSTARGCNVSLCRKEGCASLTLESTRKMHVDYYKLSYNEQSLLLLKHIQCQEITRRRINKTDQNSRKMASFSYNIDGKPVCCATLAHVFSLSDGRIRTMQGKIKSKEGTQKDGRGKHTNRPRAIDNDVRDLVREHIRSFPTIESHYGRTNTAKCSLASDLSLKKMFRLFQRDRESRNVTYSLYRKIFNSDFKLRFGVPRSDTCKKCDRYFAQLILAENDETENRIHEESSSHHMESETAYKQLATDSANSQSTTLCVDLQQVLFTPMLTHADVFYQRQLSSYNFNIRNMTKNEANMFLWNECIGKRGSKDIASCILLYVTSNFEKINEGEDRKLIVWSDRCVGQNNNRTMLCLFKFLIDRQDTVSCPVTEILHLLRRVRKNQQPWYQRTGNVS